MWRKENRRKYPRIKYPMPVLLAPAEGGEFFEAMANNLSAAGMEIVSPRKLDVLSKVELSFRLSEEDDYIVCQAQVVRCMQAGKILTGFRKNPAKEYVLGISFVDVDEEMGQKLREYVHAKSH